MTEAVRTGLVEEEVPRFRQYLKDRKPGFQSSRLDALLSWTLETATPRDIAARTQVSEGLEERIWKNRRSGSSRQLVEACSTKRYPASRIRRLCGSGCCHRKKSPLPRRPVHPPSISGCWGSTKPAGSC